MEKKLGTFCTATSTSFSLSTLLQFWVCLAVHLFSRQKESERDRDRETEGDRDTHREAEIQRKKDRETERDALFAFGLEILLSTAMKSSIYVNHAVNETWNQNPLIPSEKNNCFGYTDKFGYVSGKESDDF